MSRVRSLTKSLQAHDSQLFCEKDYSTGIISVYRKRTRYFTCGWTEGSLTYSHPDKFHIFSLTHNWKPDGTPVEWGTLPVLARIKAMDLWNRDIASDLIHSYEKRKASDKRNQSNNIESFLYDFRSQFAKATDGINTSNLSKTRRD